MVLWWCRGHHARRRLLLPSFALQQRACLVNMKLKWVKDRSLDSVVSREKHLRPALTLLDLISSSPDPLGARDLSPHRRHLGLRHIKISAFLRRFPLLFRESPSPSSSFHLTDAALRLRNDELQILRDTEPDIIDRLRKLLMLTADRSLPLHTIDQLRWDMGFPIRYRQTLIPRHPDLFDLVQPPGDERLWLRLRAWDPRLAVSELQRSSGGGEGEGNQEEEECLGFPVSFTRGFGLKRKCLSWLQEWQTLPYTSPYGDASGIDPRTDVSEKRIVGVFHELLHLTIGKKTERRNVSNLRKPLGLPQKFTKVFERHPGIFYLSEKLATQTVVLREAYGGGRELLNKHPLVGIREKYAAMMRAGMPVRRRDSGREMMRNASGCDSDECESGQETDESSGYDDSNSFSEGDINDVVDSHHS